MKLNLIIHYLFMIFGLTGFLVAVILRRKDYRIYLPMMALLYFNVVHLPYYCFPRYVYPVFFTFLIYSAYLVYTVCGVVRKEFRKAKDHLTA